MTDLDTVRLGTDISAPIGASIVVTPNGDTPTLSGRANLAEALRRRMATEPGALVHRPAYGCGLLSRLGVANSPGGRADLATRIRRNLLLDPRLKDCAVTVSLGDGASIVVVSVTATLRDDSQSALTFQVPR